MVVLNHGITEIIIEITVDTVNVIGVILGVVIFNQKVRSLDHIVMRFTRLQSAGPEKMNLCDTGLFNTGKILVGKFFANASTMYYPDAGQSRALAGARGKKKKNGRRREE